MIALSIFQMFCCALDLQIPNTLPPSLSLSAEP